MDVQKLQSLVEVPIEEWDKMFADLPADPIPVGDATEHVVANTYPVTAQCGCSYCHYLRHQVNGARETYRQFPQPA